MPDQAVQHGGVDVDGKDGGAGEPDDFLVVLVGGFDLNAEFEHEFEDVLLSVLAGDLDEVVVELLAPETAGHQLVLDGVLGRKPPQALGLIAVILFLVVGKLVHLFVVEALLIVVIRVAIVRYYQRLLGDHALIYVNVPVLSVRHQVHLLGGTRFRGVGKIHRQQVVRLYPLHLRY